MCARAGVVGRGRKRRNLLERGGQPVPARSGTSCCRKHEDLSPGKRKFVSLSRAPLSLGLLCLWRWLAGRLDIQRLARLLDNFPAPGVPTLVGGAPRVHPSLVCLICRDVGGRAKCGQPSRGSTAEFQSSLPRGGLLRMTIRVGTYQCKRTSWSAVAVPGMRGHHMKLSIPRFISQWEDKRTCQHLYAGRQVLFEFLDEL
jgi:hypothetical protein